MENFPEKWKYIFEPLLLEEMKKYGQQKKIKTGEKIIEAGQEVRIIPLVVSGSIKISRQDETGKELLLYYVHANESCAMTFTCCMQIEPSEITAIAEDDVEILALPLDKMDQWMTKFPSWKAFVMNTIRSRFNELLKTIDQIAFQHMDERLISYLREKVKATNSSLVNLSHEQIAQDLATSREVVSRLLKNLENEQKVVLYRKQIKVLSGLLTEV